MFEKRRDYRKSSLQRIGKAFTKGTDWQGALRAQVRLVIINPEWFPDSLHCGFLQKCAASPAQVGFTQSWLIWVGFLEGN